jgi:hypothetical protein
LYFVPVLVVYRDLRKLSGVFCAFSLRRFIGFRA